MTSSFPARLLIAGLLLAVLLLAGGSLRAEDNGASPHPPDVTAADVSPTDVVTFGTMHLAIGRKQHQGRVVLQDLVRRPHFYGVGALQELQGEITIRDGQVVISTAATGKPQPLNVDVNAPQATLLAGAWVPEWSKQTVNTDVAAADFDEFVGKAAARAGLDTTRPFMFRIDGVFHDVRLHVINGACPVHARIHGLQLPPDRQPYEADFDQIAGTVIGVYARNAAGRLTHPGTSTHVHLIFKDQATGNELTGHLEKVGIRRSAVLQLPK